MKLLQIAKKRMLPLLLSFLLLGTAILSAGAVRSFIDVKSGAWYYDTIMECAGKGYVNGMTETEFRPNQPMTRAMFATVIYRIAGEPAAPASTPFSDVKPGKWYSDAIAWAYAGGYVNGISSTVFGIDDQITREQIAAILFRISGDGGHYSVTGGYYDADRVSGYAKDAVGYAIKQGYLKGEVYQTMLRLRPQDNASRAEVATILLRAESMLQSASKDARRNTAAKLSLKDGAFLFFDTAFSLADSIDDVDAALPAEWMGKSVMKMETHGSVVTEIGVTDYLTYDLFLGGESVGQINFSYDIEGYRVFSVIGSREKEALLPAASADLKSETELDALFASLGVPCRSKTESGTACRYFISGKDDLEDTVFSYRSDANMWCITRTAYNPNLVFAGETPDWESGKIWAYGCEMTLGKTTLAEVQKAIADRKTWSGCDLTAAYAENPAFTDTTAVLAPNGDLVTFLFTTDRAGSTDPADYILTELNWRFIDRAALLLPFGSIGDYTTPTELTDAFGFDPEEKSMGRDPYTFVSYYLYTWKWLGTDSNFVFSLYYPSAGGGLNRYYLTEK